MLTDQQLLAAFPADMYAVRVPPGWRAWARNIEAAVLRAQAAARPVAWVRFCSDGDIEGPILDSSKNMCDVRRNSGAWTPLYTHPEASAPGLSDDVRKVLSDARWRITNKDTSTADYKRLDAPVVAAIDAALTRASAATVGEASKPATHGDEPTPKRGTLAWLVRLLQQLQAHGTAGEAKVYINDPTFGRVEVGGALYGIADVELTPNDDDEESTTYPAASDAVDAELALLHSYQQLAEQYGFESVDSALLAAHEAAQQQAEPSVVVAMQKQQSEIPKTIYEASQVLKNLAGDLPDAWLRAEFVGIADQIANLCQIPDSQQSEPSDSNEIACSSCGLSMDDSKALAAMKQAEPGADERAAEALKRLDDSYYRQWVKRNDHSGFVCGNINTQWIVEVVEWARAAQSGQRAGVAEGWHLVPEKPTPKMIAAFSEAFKHGSIWTDRVTHAFEAAIAAAPTQQQEGK